MNILKKLTITDLKLNKKRTIVTIIGIALATALICAVIGMITSFQKTMVNMAIKDNGDYHVKYYEIPKEQIKYITDNTTIEKYDLEHSIGYAKLDGSQNIYKPYVSVIAMDNASLNNNGIILSSGRLPKNSSEVVIEDSISSNGLVNMKVGDNITLDIGTRVYQNGVVLTQQDDYKNDCDDKTCNNVESIINTKKYSYTIVGTIKKVNETIENYSAPGYTMITYEDSKDILNEANINIAVRYKNTKDFSINTKNILSVLKSNTQKDFTTAKNTQLLESEGNLDNMTLVSLYEIGAIIVGIIIITSIFTTRNAFAISVSEKTKLYGMLSSIGATKKQIKKSVILEGLIIGLFAIPLGLIIGTIATYILVIVVNYYLADEISDGNQLLFDIPYYIYLLDALLSFITIYLSCIIPAHKAAKISPIDAIRASDDIKINPNKIKTNKLISKTLGIGGVIADKNLKRNKKKYRTTIISLVLSIATFITLYSFMQYGYATVNNIFSSYSFDLIASNVPKSNYQEYANLSNNNYSYYVVENGTYSVDSYGTDYAKNNYTELSSYQGNNNKELGLNILVYNNDYFKKYLKELGIDQKDYDKVAILFDKTLTVENGKHTVRKLFNNVSKMDVKINQDIYNFNIKDIVQEGPMGSEFVDDNSGFLAISEDYFKGTNQKDISNINDTGRLSFKTDKADQLEKAMNELKKSLNNDNIYIQNIEQNAREEQKLITLVSIFLYGFIIVISLIGVTNVFNTITTSMMLRSKEFAMLKSIGMTNKEFNHMIRLESIMYGLKSLIIGIPLGLLGSYGIYKSLSNKLDFGYLFPTNGVIISVLFVFIIVSLTMHYALRKVNKQNIIETIRQDNI